MHMHTNDWPAIWNEQNLANSYQILGYGVDEEEDEDGCDNDDCEGECEVTDIMGSR